MDSDPTSLTTTAAPQARRRPWLAIALFTLAALMLCVSLAIVWMLTTESGTRTLLSLLGRQVPMEVSGVRGALSDHLQVDRLQLNAGDNRIRLEGVQLRWQPWQLRDGQLLIDRMSVRSMTIVTAPGDDQPPQVPATLELPFRLSLRELQVGRLRVEQEGKPLLSAAEVSLSLHFDGQRHQLQLQRMDVLPEGAAGLSGRLSGALTLAAAHPFALEGEFRLSGYHAEGSARGSVQLGGSLPRLTTRFDLQLARAGRQAGLRGSAALRPFAPQPLASADLKARALDLTMLSRDLPTTLIDADIRMRSAESGSFTLNNRQRGALADGQLPVAQASGDFTLSEDGVQLSSLSVNGGEFSGDIGVQRAPDGPRVRAHGRLRQLRVADWYRLPELPGIVLNGRIDVDGTAAARPSGTLSFALEDSRFGEWPVAGRGTLAFNALALQVDALLLNVGANRLQASGQLDMAGGDLRFSIDAPRLAQLDKQVAGSLQVDGRLSGRFDAPALTARWRAESLRVPGVLAAGNAQGSLEAGSTLQAPLKIVLEGRKITLADLTLDQLQLDADGSLAEHTLALQLAVDGDRLQADARGGLDALNASARWRGQLERLQTRGRLALDSTGPAALAVSRESLTLNRLYLDSDFGRVRIEQLSRDPTKLASRGRIDGLPLASVLQLVRQDVVASSDLMLDGDWDFQLPASPADPAATVQPRGGLRLQRSRGDLVLSGTQQIALGLSTLALEARASGQRIALTLDARGRQLGTVAFGGSVATTGGSLMPSPEAPVDGVLNLELPSIAAVTALASPNVIANGSVNGKLFITGTIGDPKLSGRLQGQQLRVLLADSGFVLRDGRLDAALSGNSLMLRELSFAGSNGTGRLLLSGPVRFDDGHAAGALDWRLERFLAFDRVDRQLQVSGNGELVLADSRLDLRGEVAVDRGFFDVGQADAPELSDDVVVIGKRPQSGRALAVGIDVAVSLGDQIRLQGRGLDARIGGQLQVASAPGELLTAKGEVKVTRGTFTAYGRELAIERGVLRFDGPPSNPALDIRAMRRGTEVAAGVSIVGTAQAPRISLVSEPQVPDAEKLSWLVLGQGLSGSSTAQVGMLQDAAGALLAQGAAGGLQSQIASSLGVDSIGLARSRDNLQQRVITVGKRLSSRLYLSYQHGLQTAGSILLLRYTLSPRITLEAETGVRSVFSVFYNFAFD